MPSTAPSGARPVIQVAAGCLLNASGEVLIAERPKGKIAAGKWEFPGGKIEAGETVRQALERELREELGVRVLAARPLIRVRHDYSDRTVVLHTWLITAFNGEPHPHDNQSFAWVQPQELSRWDLLAADGPIVSALCLPADYVFTRPSATEHEIRKGLPGLPRNALLRVRLPGLAEADYARLARSVIADAHGAGLRVILDRAPTMARDLGADGWHATGAALAGGFEISRSEQGILRIASCHSPEELRQAKTLDFDAAVLGPVLPTSTHPGRVSLGWARFEDWAGASALPVYAIGGVGPAQHDDAFARYAQGIAGISAYWVADQCSFSHREKVPRRGG
jgi:8-oxo-dGTP diphosphatase